MCNRLLSTLETKVFFLLLYFLYFLPVVPSGSSFPSLHSNERLFSFLLIISVLIKLESYSSTFHSVTLTKFQTHLLRYYFDKRVSQSSLILDLPTATIAQQLTLRDSEAFQRIEVLFLLLICFSSALLTLISPTRWSDFSIWHGISRI